MCNNDKHKQKTELVDTEQILVHGYTPTRKKKREQSQIYEEE